MGNPYPVSFETPQGSGRLTGQVNFTDPANQPGGTYTPPTAREQILGNPVTIADGATTLLTWNTKAAGSTLLNLTAPTQPTVVTAGIYAVTVELEPDTVLTANGYYTALLEMDAGGDDANTTGASPAQVAGTLDAQILSLSLVYYVPAGGVVDVLVTNKDGVAARDFLLQEAIIQRIT